MADKDFLERMLSMLPEEFQDIYDDTIPEAKEIRKKMGKKVFRKVLFLRYAVNDMGNTISEIDYNAPMNFFDIEKVMGKVISKELKSNSLK